MPDRTRNRLGLDCKSILILSSGADVLRRLKDERNGGLSILDKYDGAFVAERYIDGKVVIAIDNFLDRYQIVKNIHQPWYLYLTRAEYYFYYVGIIIIGSAIGCSL